VAAWAALDNFRNCDVDKKRNSVGPHEPAETSGSQDLLALTYGSADLAD
jgi:hypothetical protein